MTLWLIVVIIVLFGYFAVAIYLHDDSSFSKITGYSYFDLWANKKAHASKKLITALDKVSGTHRVLLNVQIPSSQGTHSIDAILLHESGIYVINVKQKSGWISGREQDTEWVQSLHGGKKVNFANPIHQNKRAIFALQDVLPEINKTLYETLILFTDDCSFQQIEILSNHTDVIKTTELKSWLRKLDGERLTPNEIEAVYNALENMMQRKTQSSQKQAKSISTN